MAYQEHYTQQLLDNLRAKLLIMGSKTGLEAIEKTMPPSPY